MTSDRREAIARSHMRKLTPEDVIARARIGIPIAVQAVHGAVESAVMEFYGLRPGDPNPPPLVTHVVRYVVVTLTEVSVNTYARVIKRDHSSVFNSLPKGQAAVTPENFSTLRDWTQRALAENPVEVKGNSAMLDDLRERIESLELTRDTLVPRLDEIQRQIDDIRRSLGQEK